MNVLLINPEIPDTFWSFSYALKFIRKKAAYPPLGLLTVAAMLPDGWERRLVDLNLERLSSEDLAWAEMVFVGGMTIQRQSAETVIARCRAAGVRVVAGGPLFTCEPDDFAQVNHLVLDEAELTLPRFLQDLQAGCPEPIYRASEHCDIRQTPAPAWELVQMKKYAAMSIQFSRGCPFNCEFCNVTALFGHRPRLKTPEQALAELDRIYHAGWRGNVFFVDDNFIGNRRYLKERLLPALIRWRQGKKGCVFFTEASINLADDPELMALMVEAGFDSVFIGIESTEAASLAECQKRQNQNRDLLENVRTIQHAGLQVQGGFIVGFDHDTPGTFQKLIDFIQHSGIVVSMVGVLQAPPGTRLFDRLRKENRICGKLSGDNVDGSTNVIPAMGLDRLMDGYRTIMKQIYTPKAYYQRIRTFLSEFEAPKARTPMTIQRMLAFVRSNVHLGVFSKDRFHYWRLLIWTLSRRPRHLPLAVNLAIRGYHFRKICELYIF